jgi:polysaccharide pyruvyl transferase WcaK-like protein
MYTAPTHRLDADDVAFSSLHILIYALIPADRARLPIPRRPFAKIRNRLRRQLELLSWRLFGRWRAPYSTFKDEANSNRGDIAIRMGVKQQLIGAFHNRRIQFTECAWGELEATLKAATPVDLVVIAGGGYLFADAEGRLPPRFATDVKILGRLTCPVAAVSIGLNRLLAPDSERGRFRFHVDSRVHVSQFLSNVELISVRDNNTQRSLSLEGARHLPVIVDPAFLLPPEQLLSRRPENAPDAPLAISINMAFHGAHTAQTSRHVLPLFTGVLQRLLQEQRCRFYYFVHSDAERGIAQALRQTGLPVSVVCADVDKMLEAYRCMDIHIGQMLHSAIMAMSVGTPALSLSYDIKSAGFFELFDLTDFCLDMTTATEESILNTARRLIAGREAVTASILQRRGELQRDTRLFYSAVSRLAPAREAIIDPQETTFSCSEVAVNS